MNRLLSRRRWLIGSASSTFLAACGGGTFDEPVAADTPAGALAAGAQGSLRMPAETERQAAVMMSSPTVDYKAGWSMRAVQVQMIKALLPQQPVLYLVNTDAGDHPGDNEATAMAQALVAAGVPAAQVRQHVQFLKVPHADLWVRDTGGLFLSDGRGRQRVVDFDFDGYGFNPFAGPATREVYDFDNDLAVRVAQALDRPVLRSPLIAEGGNLHVNGRGTLIATEWGLLGRNPGWSRAAVESELQRVLGVRHVIWVPRSLASDAHTVLQTPYLIGGEPVYNVGVNHIDELVAWVDERTLLLPEVTAAEVAAAEAAGDPTAAINREVLEGIAAILARSTDQDGRPLRVVRVPEPGSIVIDIGPDDVIWQFIADLDAHPVHRLQGADRFARGEAVKLMLAASYMNFVVGNEVVLVPRFHKPGRDPALAAKDAAFQRTISQLYRGRRVVAIDADAITAGGGGMHCITQQLPR